MGELPPWDNDAERRRDQNRSSKRQEEARAQEVGGKRQRGSGVSHRAPRDVRAPEHLEELKFTDGARYTIDVRDLIKLGRQARQHGRGARLVIEFRAFGKRFIVEEG